MIPFFTDDAVTLYGGDCLDVLASLPDDSVDSVITDPPYGLAFMGKVWDTLGPSQFQDWCELWSAQCLRVLKPGGHILAFGGTRTWHRLASAIEDTGFEIRDSLAWLHGQGFPKSRNLGDGRGTAMKPAFEPVVFARKPIVGTVAENVQMHGTGALNIDACRTEGKWTTWTRKDGSINPSAGFGDDYVGGVTRPENVRNPEHPAGRWPANAILTHHANCVTPVVLPDDTIVKGCAPGCPIAELNGDGGVSRFFPTFRFEAKAPSVQRPKLDDGTSHPTVKPLDLMRWLVRLVTPPNGTVLDPFAGSGTTLEAATLEGLHSIGVERDPQYLQLCEQRLLKRPQPDLFAQ